MKPRFGETGRLLLVASAVALFIMGIAIGGAFYAPHYVNLIPWKWFRFAAGTAFFVWFSLNAYWRVRRLPLFWSIFTIFLLIHCVGIGHFYYSGPGLSIMEVALLSGVEWVCMALVLHWILHAVPDFRPRSPRSSSGWTPTF